MNVQYFTLIFSLAETQKRQIPLSCILIRLYISLRATVSLLLPKLEDVHTNYLFCLSRHFAQYIKLQQTGNKSNNRICQVAQPSSENQIQEFVFCLLWKLCRETRCINLQSNSVTGFNYKPSPAIFFPPQWISSASVTPDEELRKSCWHFDRCTTTFFCGTVRVQIPGGDVALPLEYKTNPHMPAWQITYRYLCDLHQCGTSNRSCGGGGDQDTFRYVSVMEKVRLSPRYLRDGLYLQSLMTQKSSWCVSAPFISATDAHAAQSNTSMRAAAAADSSEEIHRALALICDPCLCPRISFPPSGDS